MEPRFVMGVSRYANKKDILMRLPLTALVGLVALPVLAQSQFFEVDDVVPLPGFDLNVDEADELDVHDVDGNKIGEVEAVVGSNRALASGFAVDFEDGLTEYGDVTRVVPLEEFEFDGTAFVMSDDIDVTRLPTRLE